MNHLNSVLLEGYLVNDPKVITTSDPNQTFQLVKFDVANHRVYRNGKGEMKEETLFIPIQVWGSISAMCLEKMKKGMVCRVVGRLRQCRWETKDGAKRSSIEIYSHHLEYRNPAKKNQQEPEILENDEDEEELAETVVLYQV